MRRFTTASELKIALEAPVLVVRRNAKMSIRHERALLLDESERLTEIMYMDAKDEYMSGRYLVDVPTCVKLAGLQLAADFGSFIDANEGNDLIRFVYFFSINNMRLCACARVTKSCFYSWKFCSDLQKQIARACA